MNTLLIDGPAKGRVIEWPGNSFDVIDPTEGLLTFDPVGDEVTVRSLGYNITTYRWVGNYVGVRIMSSADFSVAVANVQFMLDRLVQDWLLSGGPFVEAK